MLDGMNEPTTAADTHVSQSGPEAVAQASPPRSRRLRLRHEAAVVAAEIERMRRLGWTASGQSDA